MGDQNTFKKFMVNGAIIVAVLCTIVVAGCGLIWVQSLKALFLLRLQSTLLQISESLLFLKPYGTRLDKLCITGWTITRTSMARVGSGKESKMI